MYVESGEEALGEIVRAIAAQLGLGPAQSISAEEAIAFWGRNLGGISPSAPTAAYEAGARLISVGCPPIAQSQDGSRAILFRTGCTSVRRNQHHSVLLSKNEERD